MAQLNNTRNMDEVLLTIYCFVDDFLNTVLTQIKPALHPAKVDQKTPPRKKHYLSLSEGVTLGLFRYYAGKSNWKDTYWHIKTYHYHDFPTLPCYSKFVETMNKMSPVAAVIGQVLAAFFRKNTPIHAPKFGDASKLKLCEIKREFSHKVCKGLAAKSKSTMGWFYGFKLHLVCNEMMQILSFCITPGNTDDRKGLELIWQHIFGLIVADAGYVGKVFKTKAESLNKTLFTGVRANMKKLMTSYQHHLLKLRQCVETVFSVLKLRFLMESTLSRSPFGFFSHYLWALAAYQLKQFFKLKNPPKSFALA